ILTGVKNFSFFRLLSYKGLGNNGQHWNLPGIIGLILSHFQRSLGLVNRLCLPRRKNAALFHSISALSVKAA
ncbi:MAG: hypothetical protein ACO3NK_16505, partial [Prochlorotrichaceae cyanobacterium]